ncbi:MAG: hypothetical protein HY726_10710 [Candidatus Rokubacteria bacterium]|nr:hypothetical protein [Candidatus Rokubacteria bacterium]
MARPRSACGASGIGQVPAVRVGAWAARWPRWARVALVGGLCLGALGMPASAPFARFAVYWVLLLVMPGLVLLDLTFGRRSFGLLEKVPLAFCLSLLTLAVPGILAYGLRLQLETALLLFFGLSGLALVLFMIQPSPEGDRPAGGEGDARFEGMVAVALAVLLGLTAVLAYRYAGYAFTDRLADIWYHMSFVRKLFENGVVDPANPFLKGEGVEFIYGYNLWHLVLAVLARANAVDPVEASAYAAPFVGVTYLLAIYPLGRVLFGPRVGLSATFAYVLIHVVVMAMDSMLNMVKPSTIAIWILSPVTLAFLVLYLKEGTGRALWCAALINAVPAVLHVTESLGILWALGLLMGGALLCSEKRRDKTRLIRAFGLVGVVVLVVLAFKAPLISGQSESLSEYAPQRPLHLGLGLMMTNPYYSDLRDPVQIAALLLAPLLFIWLRSRIEVQLLVLVPLLHFMVEFNPLLATGVASLAGEVFLRKVVSWLRILNVISLSAILYLYLPSLGAWLRRARGVQWGRIGVARAGLALAVGLAILTGAIGFFAHQLQSLTGFAHAKLAIADRHLLKELLVAPIGMLALLALGLMATMEFLTGGIGATLRRVVTGERAWGPRWPLVVMGATTIVLVLGAIPLLEARYTLPSGGPYPRDLSAIIPEELAFLRDRVVDPAVVLVKPREHAFDVTTPAFFLQAFTRHYGVSLPDPDYKKTRSSIDYQGRFRDAKRIYSGEASVEEVVLISRRYAVDYIVTSRDGDRLYQMLSSAPASFSKVYERDNGTVFKVRLERG